MAEYQNIYTGWRCAFVLRAHLVFVTKYRVSSRRLRQEYPDLVRQYWRAHRLWSGSYFAASVGGAPLSIVRQYIEQQNHPL